LKTVFWDWNGTLLDDVWTGTAAMNTLLKRYNLPLLHDTAHYREVFCFPVSEYYKKVGLGGELFSTTSHEWMDEYNAREGQCLLREGAMEALNAFRAAGWRQVVLSATRRDMLEEQIAQFSIRHYFETVLGLGDIYAGSKEDIGRQYLQTCGIAPQETLVIGDTLHDADVARAIGANCVLVSRGHQSREMLLTAGVPVVHTLREAAAYAL